MKLIVCGVLVAGIANTLFAQTTKPLDAVPFTSVKVADAFWAPRIKINREKVLPHNFKFCETTGRIRNFARAAGMIDGKFEGIFFNDSDVYKVLEGAAYSLAHERDAAMENTCDDVIAQIAAAQQKDGYLYTFYTVNKQLDKRWSNEKDMHETYCAGHLIEAAVAYFQTTGKRTLLDVAIRVADHIDTIFGPGKKRDVPGHEEIELALVKLYRITNQPRYLKLAEFFVEQRGNVEGRASSKDYSQDHLPVRQQREIAGHAVRAMYLYSGVADLAASNGDAGYIDAMDALWHDVVDRKMYITGGIGPSAHNEGFTVPYDLPNDSAYAETCASIGMVMWNHRLNLLHADGKYADVVERVMYNGALSGVSLDGDKFFYVNPLASRGHHHRQPWYDCACCPTNVTRWLPTVGGYAYATRGDEIFINHYIAGSAKIGGTTIQQETNYPWDERVKLSITTAQPKKLRLRIPGWCEGTMVSVNNDAPEKLEIDGEYAKLDDVKNGDVIQFNMAMPVRRVYADPNVKADAGRVSLARGPIVYCLEGVDNAEHVRNIFLPKNVKLETKHREDLLSGVTVVIGSAKAVDESRAVSDVTFTAVPYYAWDNRVAGEMVVWLPESAELAEIPRTTKVTASFASPRDTSDSLEDPSDPPNSAAAPRFTWWDHKGTAEANDEWLQYDFKSPRKISKVRVYWFDDESANGGCRVPQSWRLLYKSGEEWKPVNARGEFPVKRDAYNTATFDLIETSSLRLEAKLQRGFSSGVIRLRVE